MHPQPNPISPATQAQLITRACEPRLGDTFTGQGGVSCVVTGLGGGKVSYEWRGQDGTKIHGITTLEDYRTLVTNTINGGHTFTPAKSMMEIIMGAPLPKYTLPPQVSTCKQPAGWTSNIKIDDNGQRVTVQPFVGPDFITTLLKGGACG